MYAVDIERNYGYPWHDNYNIKKFEVGTKVIIVESVRTGTEKGGNSIQKKMRKGTVIFTNDFQFVVKFKSHAEGFKYCDILTEDIEIRRVKK